MATIKTQQLSIHHSCILSVKDSYRDLRKLTLIIQFLKPAETCQYILY